jgi:transcriptional regulator of heat shock response
MEPRQQQLLKFIIDDYIQTAEPVGSRCLVERYHLDISPATVRNEMSLLEEEGYLRQAHTSSGRIPTEKAYEFYLKEVLGKGGKGGEGGKDGNAFGHLEHEQNKESAVKSIAKRLMEVSGETAIVAFDPNWSFYTGVSNLMQKPEFQDSVSTLAGLVDQFDEVVSDMFDRVSHEPQVFIGSHNPFGDQMTTIIVRYDFPNTSGGILGLVGPMRMDYARNLALLEAAKKIINELSEE